MLVLKIIEKNQRSKINIFSGKCYSLTKDDIWKSKSETNKYTTKQIKIYRKQKNGTTLRVAKKNFQDEELPHQFFQTTKLSKDQ